MFVPIDDVLKKELYESSNAFVKPRLKHITRSQHDFFFYKSKSLGEEIGCFDRFQNRADFNNEIRKMLIKPVVALNLAAKYEIDADATLLFLLIDILTSADDDTVSNTLFRGISDQFYAIYYLFYAVALFADAALELGVRATITLIEYSCESILNVVYNACDSLNDIMFSKTSQSSPKMV